MDNARKGLQRFRITAVNVIKLMELRKWDRWLDASPEPGHLE